MKTNENENTTVQNLWDAAKAVLRGKHIAIQATSRSKKNLKQPNLAPKGARKRTNKPKTCRRKEIIKIRAEVNDTETNKQTNKNQKNRSMKPGAGSLKKTSKTDQPLTRLITKKRERSQVNKITNEELRNNQHHRNTNNNKRT